MEASANGIRERLDDAERRIADGEGSRRELWGEVRVLQVTVARLEGYLRRIEDKLDAADKLAASDREAREAHDQAATSKRFQIGLIILSALASPLVLGAAYIISQGSHP